MSDAEDDYLSDKFLAQTVTPSSSQKLTYAERRRDAQRKAELKNVQNRKKSRRQLEEESRQEGLSKSLFERAKEEGNNGAGGSKAMTMMLKVRPYTNIYEENILTMASVTDGVQTGRIAGQKGRSPLHRRKDICRITRTIRSSNSIC